MAELDLLYWSPSPPLPTPTTNMIKHHHHRHASGEILEGYQKKCTGH